MTFQNKIDPELITLLARGNVDIGMADGTSLIPAVSQGIPVVYGATIYGRDPNVVFAPAETGIDERRRPGRRDRRHPGPLRLVVGGPAGAARPRAGLTPEDVEIVTYPDFGQGVAVATGPGRCGHRLRDQRAGPAGRCRAWTWTCLHVADVAPLPGPGPGHRRGHTREQGRRAAGLHRGHGPSHGGHHRRPAAGAGGDVRAGAGAGRRPGDAAGHPRGHHRLVDGRPRRRTRPRQRRPRRPGSRGWRSCAHCPTRSSATR